MTSKIKPALSAILIPLALVFSVLFGAGPAAADNGNARCSVSSAAAEAIRCPSPPVELPVKAPAWSGPPSKYDEVTAKFRQATNPVKEMRLCSGGMIIKPHCRR